MNQKFKIAFDEVLPTIHIDAAILSSLDAVLSLRVTLRECDRVQEDGPALFYGYDVCQIMTTGEIILLATGKFDTSTMTTLQAIMSAGHLAGDFIKFYFKGGK